MNTLLTGSLRIQQLRRRTIQFKTDVYKRQVDDDEMLCKTAVNTLSSIGIEAEWTLSGEQAIDMVIEHHSCLLYTSRCV